MIYKQLNEARAQFHAQKLKKTGRNEFAKYDYFELADFLIPAMQAFAKNDLVAVISFDKDLATMTIVNINKPDERIVITSPMGSAALKGCHEVQNIGAVETYQRRYLWCAAMEVVEHDVLERTTTEDDFDSVLMDHLAALEECSTMDSLSKTFTDAIKACGNDQGKKAMIIAAKDRRKAQLSK